MNFSFILVGEKSLQIKNWQPKKKEVLLFPVIIACFADSFTVSLASQNTAAFFTRSLRAYSTFLPHRRVSRGGVLVLITL